MEINERTVMQSRPAQSHAEAVRNTLEVKLSIARLRAQHAPTQKERESEAKAAETFARKLSKLA